MSGKGFLMTFLSRNTISCFLIVRNGSIDDITKKTLKELIKYLKSVKIGVVRENEASKMVSKILEDKAPVVLPEYMI